MLPFFWAGRIWPAAEAQGRISDLLWPFALIALGAGFILLTLRR